MRVEQVEPEATHDLRARVLRCGRLDAAAHPEDDTEGALHLVVIDDGGRTVGVASLYPQAAPWGDQRRAVRLRGMAVEPAQQGRGIGRLLTESAIARLRGDGVEVLWANARDTALGFYERLGFAVVGEGFAEIGIAHHVVVVDL